MLSNRHTCRMKVFYVHLTHVPTTRKKNGSYYHLGERVFCSRVPLAQNPVILPIAVPPSRRQKICDVQISMYSVRKMWVIYRRSFRGRDITEYAAVFQDIAVESRDHPFATCHELAPALGPGVARPFPVRTDGSPPSWLSTSRE